MKKEDINVIVLMSTYNGERYIQQQLDSILNQDFQGFISIYIRDDGSSDSTKKIVQNLKMKEKRSIKFVEGENLGPQRSFLELIRTADDADYYFFADQDDVWFTDKISKAVDKMQKSSLRYVLACTDYTVTDMELNVLKEKNVNMKDDTFNVLRIIFYNEFPGCTMGFNRELLLFMKSMNIESCMMHDSLALAVAASVGEVIYDSEPSILHRIHADNVVGYGHKKIKPLLWIKEKVTLVFKKDDYDLSQMAEQILVNGKDYMSEKNKSDLILLRDFKKSFGNTLKLLNHKDSKNVFDRTTMSIRCKIFFHVF